MSIEGKHSYRFGYLKSESWERVRLEALLREKGKCQICGEESIYNDAQHIWYPENVYDTKEVQLVILCRACHNFLHAILPECKTNDELKGKLEWKKFSQAVITWRFERVFLFSENQSLDDFDAFSSSPKVLRTRLKEITNELIKAKGMLSERGIDFKGDVVFKDKKEPSISEILATIKKWHSIYSASCVNSSVADSDFQI